PERWYTGCPLVALNIYVWNAGGLSRITPVIEGKHVNTIDTETKTDIGQQRRADHVVHAGDKILVPSIGSTREAEPAQRWTAAGDAERCWGHFVEVGICITHRILPLL